MKKRTLIAGAAAVALAMSTLGMPSAYAYEPGGEPVTAEEVAQGLAEISFATSDGAYIEPGQTIELTADAVGEGIAIRNAYIETAPGQTSPQWRIARSVNEDGLPVLAITAPVAPEEQFGATQEYGEYTVHIHTSNWNSYYLTINFVEEAPVIEEPVVEEPEVGVPGRGVNSAGHPVFGSNGKHFSSHPVFGVNGKRAGEQPWR